MARVQMAVVPFNVKNSTDSPAVIAADAFHAPPPAAPAANGGLDIGLDIADDGAPGIPG